MKNIYILGAAGSIGLQTMDVIQRDKDMFHIIGISLGKNDEINDRILDKITCEIVCLRDPNQMSRYQEKYPSIHFVFGDEGLIAIASYPKKGLFINALSGSSGLIPTVFAIKAKKDIALANKETLVMAGDIINDLVKEYKVNLYPIDSEHSALWQVLRGEKIEDVKKLVITASGGSFRDLNREQLKHVTIEDALKHPNWSMGAKITIDSATMMNKVLEVIEAHHLFHIPYHQIETILHKESVVHGLVYFKDGTIKASLSLSDMKIPIAYALHYPEKRSINQELELKNLSFSPMDENRFPLIKLAYHVGNLGGILPTVMNAANEAAVKLFLNGDIQFLDIETIVMNKVLEYSNISNPSLDDIIQVNDSVQQQIIHMYGKR